MGGELVHFINGYAQKGRHLVDECAGTSGAGAVHALLHAACEEDYLCILAPKLYNAVCIRIVLLHGDKGGMYLLHKGQSCRIGKTQTRRACNSHSEPCIGVKGGYLLHLLRSGLPYLGEVALISGVYDLTLVEYYCLNSGGAYVNSQIVNLAHQNFPFQPLYFILI